MVNPKVSILVPVYNVEKHVEKCVVSLLSQTYNHIEFIFVDDCSQDNSISIIKRVLLLYPSRTDNVRIISHEVNRGLAAARNTAIQHASGEYFLIVDSDDYLDVNAVTLLVDKMMDSNADIVISDAFFVYENCIRRYVSPQLKSPQEYLNLALTRQISLSVWGKLYNRKLFGDVRFVEGINFGEDYSMLPRLLYNSKKIVKIDTPIYYYIQYNLNSYTKNLSLEAVEQVCAANGVLSSFFQDKGEKYHELILQSKLYLKLHLLKCVYNNRTLLKEVIGKYTEVDDKAVYLPLKNRVVFYLARKRLYGLLSVYMNLALFVKKHAFLYLNH